MTAQQLKNSVLELAMQGKLVPQNPGDEPASVSLGRIRAEKQRLMKEGEIRKSKKNADGAKRGITAGPPFEIPESWEWVRLRQIGEIITGSTPSTAKTEYYGADFCFFKPADLDAGANIVSSKDMLSREGYDASHRIPPGSVLVTCIGATIGKSGINRVEGACNQQINAVIPNRAVNPEFLYHCCASEFFRRSIKSNAASATLPIIIKSKFADLPVPLPPLAEQLRIVGRIGELLPHIAAYAAAERELAKLDAAFPAALKKSILQAAVRGKLIPPAPPSPSDEPASVLLARIKAEKEARIKAGKTKPVRQTSGRDKRDSVIVRRDNSNYETQGATERRIDGEIPFDIPENWAWARLGNVGEWGAGATPNKGNPAFYAGGTIPWLLTGDLNDGHIGEVSGRITELALAETSVRLNPAGSVLIAMYGTIVGKAGILDIEATTNQACCACLPVSDVHNEYLFYFLLSQKSAFQKLSAGGTQPNISREKIVATLIPLPPLPEQRRIVAQIEKLFGMCGGI